MEDKHGKKFGRTEVNRSACIKELIQGKRCNAPDPSARLRIDSSKLTPFSLVNNFFAQNFRVPTEGFRIRYKM